MPLPAHVRRRLLLADLAAEQDGVLTRAQLASYGVTRGQVCAEVTACRWQTPAQRVVVMHGGPLTVRQQRWVAVLAQPPGAVLAGLTAAAEHGLVGFDCNDYHVLVRLGSRPHHLPGVRVHVSRRFESERDVAPGLSVPTVRIERGLVDAAAWSRSPRMAVALLAAGVQQRLTTAPRLRAELDRAGAVRHRAQIGLALGDIEGGAQSFAEIDFGRLARRAGLPPPVRQVVRVDRDGRRRYLDADFEWFSVEVDGALQLRPQTYWDDMARQNDLVIVTGKPVLRFSSYSIRFEQDRVVGQLRLARERFGRSC